MTYKPFKMRSSPMKRNFGIGEKEEASPGKVIPQAEVASKTFDEAKAESDEEKKGKDKVSEPKKGKGIFGKILGGLGASLQAGIDAGAGTTYGADKEAKMEAAEKKKLKLENDELLHKRAMEKINAGKNSDKIPGDTNGDGIVDEKDTKLNEEGKGEGTPEEENPEEENGE